MGRETRQARRARERRLQQQGRKQHTSNSAKWWLWIGAGVVVLVALVLGTMAVKGSGPNTTATATAESAKLFTPVPSLKAGPARCTYNEMVQSGFYHVHSSLTILHDGTHVPIPNNIGFDINHDCLYWVHTHKPSYDIIHIESPYKITPTLGNFFQVWGAPLSSSEVWQWSVSPNTLHVFVNQKPYSGNPANIKLRQHVDITIEIGKTVVPPKPFNFSKYQV